MRGHGCRPVSLPLLVRLLPCCQFVGGFVMETGPGATGDEGSCGWWSVPRPPTRSHLPDREPDRESTAEPNPGAEYLHFTVVTVDDLAHEMQANAHPPLRPAPLHEGIEDARKQRPINAAAGVPHGRHDLIALVREAHRNRSVGWRVPNRIR